MSELNARRVLEQWCGYLEAHDSPDAKPLRDLDALLADFVKFLDRDPSELGHIIDANKLYNRAKLLGYSNDA